MSDDAPIPRATARVLPVDESGRVLLLLDRDPARPEAWRWGTIGGAIDGEESAVEAAVRELFEETGVRVATADLVGPVHRDVREFSYAGVAYVGDSTFYALALSAGTEITFDHLEPAEIGNVAEARWWLPDDVAVDGRLVAPDLPAVMTAAVRALGGVQ